MDKDSMVKDATNIGRLMGLNRQCVNVSKTLVLMLFFPVCIPYPGYLHRCRAKTRQCKGSGGAALLELRRAISNLPAYRDSL